MERLILEPPPSLRFDARRSLAGEGFEEDLTRVLEALRGAGITSVVAADLTRPEVARPRGEDASPPRLRERRAGGPLRGEGARADVPRRGASMSVYVFLGPSHPLEQAQAAA